jgi:hypothetical protein
MTGVNLMTELLGAYDENIADFRAVSLDEGALDPR